VQIRLFGLSLTLDQRSCSSIKRYGINQRLPLIVHLTEVVRGSGKKDKFDRVRAERMDWISLVLSDGNVELYRRLMPDRKLRRIALFSSESYAVITQVERNGNRAQFVTAYTVNSAAALGKMRSNLTW
jgi:hypothetical protein